MREEKGKKLDGEEGSGERAMRRERREKRDRNKEVWEKGRGLDFVNR